MLKKTIALTLALSLLAAGLWAVPPALASDYYSARTPLIGAIPAKLNNISLAIEAIDGAYIPHGGSFSFNEAVGPRISARGFQSAPNGRGVIVTGGGVAQVATTLYLALLEVREDIEIDPVETYGSRFIDNYVADTSKAVITDYDADIDLSFTNYAEDMTIDMWANDSYVYCSITVGGDDASFAGESDAFAGVGWGLSPFGPIQTAAPTRRLIASVSLDCGDEDGVVSNVKLAADSVNDTTLDGYDLFSFNDVVGPRTKQYGYKRATNGRGARVVGGGVAQVASALWLAVKDLSDISIVEKSTYGKQYNQNYVSSSSDAILTDYSSGRDFSFRYTGAGSITIYTYVTDGWLYCDIYLN